MDPIKSGTLSPANNQPVFHRKETIFFMLFVLLSSCLLSWFFLLLHSSFSPDGRASFYEKAAMGKDVRLLIVGDSIACDTGETHWSHLVEQELEKTYHLSVSISNISLRGTSSYAGMVSTQQLPPEETFDAVLVCYGQNDPTEDFSLYYEALLRAVRQRCPSASVVTILESSQRTFTQKMNQILDLSAYYQCPTVDTITPFQASYDTLVRDGVHPNEEGDRIYAQEILRVLEEGIRQHRGPGPSALSPKDERVLLLDELHRKEKPALVEKDSGFVWEGPLEGWVLGVDFWDTPDNGTIRILVDDKEYILPQSGYSQRLILPIMLSSADHPQTFRDIRVEFEEGEQGIIARGGFKGLLLSS